MFEYEMICTQDLLWYLPHDCMCMVRMSVLLFCLMCLMWLREGVIVTR